MRSRLVFLECVVLFVLVSAAAGVGVMVVANHLIALVPK